MLAVMLAAAPAFQPGARSLAFARPLVAVRPILLVDTSAAPLPEDRGTPPAPAPAPPAPPARLPEFSWRAVIFFALNPAVMLPVPLIAAFLFRLDVLGANFAASRAVLITRALPFSAAMVALSVIPFEKIPQLRSLAEVTRASKVITLYAFGRRFAPLRALPAALIIATSAAVCEELAFRGTLQARTSATRRACSARARPR